MSNIKIFEDKKIRAEWNADEEDWYWSVVDVVEILSDCKDVKDYIKKMRLRDPELKAKWGTICHPVDSTGKDGKKRKILMTNTKNLLRLVQSIPSKKAEPFKMWLAQVGSERLDEIVDPQKAMDRAIDTYRKKGYTEEWITQRLLTIKTRKELTKEWQDRGITQEKDYAILTNEITKAWSGLSVKEYKNLKNLKKENLRDNMTDLELVLNMLAEVSTTAISKQEKPTTLAGNKKVARAGGQVAKNARIDLEKRIKGSVISPINATDKLQLEQNTNGEDE